MKQSFLIAAPTSGSGKTTIARGLMALLARKGYRVQPFKCGPDYIDTKFHAAVCGRPSINLDTFMATPQHVRDLFEHYGSDADVRVVEGMMGLFDGYDRDQGSSAEVARVLDIPVVLVVDARSAAYSMAPLIAGFVHFHPDVRISGVIFNRVASPRHQAMLQQVCSDLQVECLGYLPRRPELEQGSRYLGLDFSQHPESQLLVALLEQHVQWQRLLELASESRSQGKCACTVPRDQDAGCRRTLIARNDESFSFIYQEVIDSLNGVDFFDPETDVPCLDDVDLLYLPGGYPEKHLDALVANEACRQAIKAYADRGGRVIAECGGMMYLCQAIVTDEGQFEMCGVLPHSITARKADRHLSLGYRRFVLDGKEYRGHEFHYTQFVPPVPQSVTQVYNAKGEPVPTPILRYRNVLASYTHLYSMHNSLVTRNL